MIALLFRLAIILAPIVTPLAARAAERVTLSSDIFVERVVASANGANRVILEKPAQIMPGDRLLFVVHYRNAGTTAASNLVLTNPLPSAVAFDGSGDAPAAVSVDGGANWGTLSALTIKDRQGIVRPATAADVTHVQWRITRPLAAGSEGKLLFRGIVR